MKYQSLEEIEWHDLPVRLMSIGVSGISLVVMPYCEIDCKYIPVRVTLSAMEGIRLEINGSPSAKDLSDLELSLFQYAHLRPGCVSGRINLLPGMAGLWRVSFTKANWELSTPVD